MNLPIQQGRFFDSDFIGSYVTDRQDPTIEQIPKEQNKLKELASKADSMVTELTIQHVEPLNHQLQTLSLQYYYPNLDQIKIDVCNF